MRLLCAALLWLALPAWGQASAIPYHPESAGSGELALRALGGLAACAVVGAAAMWVWLRARRPQPGLGIGNGRHLELLESRALGTKSRLLVMRYGTLQLLLSQNEAGVTLLHQAPAAAPGDATA